MYKKNHIKLLNQWGMLSSHFLMVKFKLNIEYARALMKNIVENFSNVVFIDKDRIVIQERRILSPPKKSTSKEKYQRIRKIKTQGEK